MAQIKNFDKAEVKKIMFKSKADGRLAVAVEVKDGGIVLEMENITQPRFFDRETIENGFVVITDTKIMVKQLYLVKCNKRGILPRLVSEADCYSSAEYIASCLETHFEITTHEVYLTLLDFMGELATK